MALWFGRVYEAARCRYAFAPGAPPCVRRSVRLTVRVTDAMQVAMSSLENTLLKWSVKGYLLSAGLCHLATGKVDAITKASRPAIFPPRRSMSTRECHYECARKQAVDRYEQLDVTFASCREGDFLRVRIFSRLVSSPWRSL